MDTDRASPRKDSLLVAKSDRTELRKPLEMIVLVPRGNRVTLTGRRIYNAMLQVAQSRMQVMPDMPSADFMFDAPLPALLRTSGSSGEDRTAAKRYLREMRGMEVDWQSPNQEGDGIKWQGFSMLSEVAIEVRNGENWVRWSYPPTLMSALKHPHIWARIDLDVVAKLSTYSALALYEICARYRNNPSGLTCRQTTQWWADALSGTPPGSERREWRKFKNERVNPSIVAINEETDLEIGLTEDSKGRGVERIQFTVRQKRVPVKSRVVGQSPVDANLVLRAESLGIRENKLEPLMKEFGEAPVRDGVNQLERRMTNQQFPTVDNPYSYLRSLLRNGVGDEPTADALSSLVQNGSPIPLLAPVLSSPAVPIRMPPSAQEKWMEARIVGLKAEIEALADPDRKHWVDAAIADMSAKKMFSAVIARRTAQGDVMYGALGSTIVRLYATARYGKDWDREVAGPG